MTVIHRITGYDKRTELLELEYDVPHPAVPVLREIIHVPNDDPEAVGSYPLDVATALQIGHKLDKVLNVDACDWFFEPFSIDS